MNELSPRDIVLIEASVPTSGGDVVVVYYPSSVKDVAECLTSIRQQMRQSGVSSVQLYTTAKNSAKYISTLLS